MDGIKVLISDEEKDFIVSCVEQDFRIDGRSCGDYRNIRVRRGIASNTHGSALVNISNTQVLVGVKAELQESDSYQGRIETSVDFSADVLPVYDSREGEDLTIELRSNLQRMINNSQIDLKELSVVQGKYCWTLYVDAVVLEYDGNLLDTLSVCVKAALEDVQLPKLTVSREGDKIDIEVSDDPYDTKSIGTKNVPVIVTLSKIGSRFAVDTCPEEESCSSSKVIMMVNSSGEICGIQKYGATGLNPEYLLEMLEFGKSAGRTLMNMTGTLVH